MFRRSLWVRYLAKLEPQINVHSHHFLPRLYTSHSAETSSPLPLFVSCQTMGRLDNEKAAARALKAKATRIENARQAALESERLAKETERGLTLCCRFKVKRSPCCLRLEPRGAKTRALNNHGSSASASEHGGDILPHDSLARQQASSFAG